MNIVAGPDGQSAVTVTHQLTSDPKGCGLGFDLESGGAALRPIAHWVLFPSADGRRRLTMIWEIPSPLPPAA